MTCSFYLFFSNMPQIPMWHFGCVGILTALLCSTFTAHALNDLCAVINCRSGTSQKPTKSDLFQLHFRVINPMISIRL